MKKIIALVLALMLTVTCFAACGKKDGDTKKKYTVGICNYVDDASLNQIVDNIKSSSLPSPPKRASRSKSNTTTATAIQLL